MAKKSIQDIAFEVIFGKWSTGKERKQKLKRAGYDYDKVQTRVNDILKKKSTETIAKEVINGKWGSGSTRKKRLEKVGYNYDKVQKRVNEILTRTVYIGHAQSNEKGTLSGGKPGDQTGKECVITKWYADNWLYVFRAKDKAIRKKLGQYMTDTCNNNNIGYNIDKPNRYAAWDNAEKNEHDIKGIKVKGDTTCSQAVSMCMRACGIPKKYAPRHCDIAILTKAMLSDTEYFTKHTAKSYVDSTVNLEVGDILLNSHHTAIVVKID